MHTHGYCYYRSALPTAFYGLAQLAHEINIAEFSQSLSHLYDCIGNDPIEIHFTARLHTAEIKHLKNIIKNHIPHTPDKNARTFIISRAFDEGFNTEKLTNEINESIGPLIGVSDSPLGFITIRFSAPLHEEAVATFWDIINSHVPYDNNHKDPTPSLEDLDPEIIHHQLDWESGEYTTCVIRLSPKEFNGIKTEGYIGSFPGPALPSFIYDDFGGGTYLLLIRGPVKMPSGRIAKKEVDRRTIVITGDPVTVPSKTPKTPPTKNIITPKTKPETPHDRFTLIRGLIEATKGIGIEED